MITEEEYIKAKAIVDQYEQEQHLDEQDDWDDDYDDGLALIDEQDRQDEEDYERALSCTCGAWVVGKSGKGIHVADCFCGAD